MYPEPMQTLCQECRLDRPYEPDWKVKRVTLTTEARRSSRPLSVPYPFYVIGRYDGGEMYWSVPSIADWRYDLTEAVFDAEVLQAFGITQEDWPEMWAKIRN